VCPKKFNFFEKSGYGFMGKIVNKFSNTAEAIIFNGCCYDFVKTIPDKSVMLVVTSPPYNIGKKYEKKIKSE
jgi:adenine-specific DNA-methyltransferase